MFDVVTFDVVIRPGTTGYFKPGGVCIISNHYSGTSCSLQIKEYFHDNLFSLLVVGFAVSVPTHCLTQWAVADTINNKLLPNVKFFSVDRFIARDVPIYFILHDCA